MANEAAAHREYYEKIAKKWGLGEYAPIPGPEVTFHTDSRAIAAIDEAVRTALEKAAQAVMPEDFDKGSSEWCALCAAQESIRSIVLRADDVREEG